jgi:hypothetical protein
MPMPMRDLRKRLLIASLVLAAAAAIVGARALYAQVQARPITIEGVVLDDDGHPLPGAPVTISVKLTNGTRAEHEANVNNGIYRISLKIAPGIQISQITFRHPSAHGAAIELLSGDRNQVINKLLPKMAGPEGYDNNVHQLSFYEDLFYTDIKEDPMSPIVPIVFNALEQMPRYGNAEKDLGPDKVTYEEGVNLEHKRELLYGLYSRSFAARGLQPKPRLRVERIPQPVDPIPKSVPEIPNPRP